MGDFSDHTFQRVLVWISARYPMKVIDHQRLTGAHGRRIVT